MAELKTKEELACGHVEGLTELCLDMIVFGLWTMGASMHDGELKDDLRPAILPRVCHRLEVHSFPKLNAALRTALFPRDDRLSLIFLVQKDALLPVVLSRDDLLS